MAVYPEVIENGAFDPEDWISEPRNVALTDETGNFGLFTYDYLGMFTGHYFLRSRGREAKTVAVEMISMLFNDFEAKAICGLTPLKNRPARWMNRQLGFKGLGVISVHTGPHELVLLTKEDFFNKVNAK